MQRATQNANSLPPHDDPRWVSVSNLPREANEAWIGTLFSSVGRVELVDFLGNEGPGSASVLFASVEQATAALRFDGYVALGIALLVRPKSDAMARSNPSPRAPLLYTSTPPSVAYTRLRSINNTDARPTHKNLYVLNIPMQATTDQLTALFSSYGTVVHCVILAMMDAQSRRRGFIDMSCASEAKEAIEGLNGFVWHGYPIEVSYAIVQRSGGPFEQGAGQAYIKRNVPRNRFNTGPRRVPSDSATTNGCVAPGSLYRAGLGGPPSPGISDSSSCSVNDNDVATDPCTLFISGLDPAAILDDEDFRNACEPYGTVTAASLSRDQDGISRGFGIVTFGSENAATYAKENIDGHIVNRRRLSAHKLVYQRNRQGFGAVPLHHSPGSNHFALPPASLLSASTALVPSASSVGATDALLSDNNSLFDAMPLLSSNSNMTYSPVPPWLPQGHLPQTPSRLLNATPMGAIGANVAKTNVPKANASHTLHCTTARPNSTSSWFRSNSTPRPVEIRPDPRDAERQESKEKHQLGEPFKQKETKPTHAQATKSHCINHSSGMHIRGADASDLTFKCNPRSEIMREENELEGMQTPGTWVTNKSASATAANPSPETTRSMASAMSTPYSVLNTPNISGNDGSAIWNLSTCGHPSQLSSMSPWATNSIKGGVVGGKVGEHGKLLAMTGSALLSLQDESLPHFEGLTEKRSKIVLAPVGHEVTTTSSPSKSKA